MPRAFNPAGTPSITAFPFSNSPSVVRRLTRRAREQTNKLTQPSDTCRQRKVKCTSSRFSRLHLTTGDEAQPVCGQCARASRPCSRGTLADADTARLFHSYMTAVAPWYDLGDARRHFGTLVPQLALREPLLFNAVLALAGMHAAQTGHGGKKTAAEFHGRCVRQLIALDDDSDLLDNGVALAATCLLRSYEILDGACPCEFAWSR